MDNRKLMLLDWMRKVHQLEYAHCYQSIYYSKLERRIGIWAFVLATLAAFSYRFPFINNETFKDYILQLILLASAILTGLQSFLKPNEKSEIHRKLGLEYERLRHDIEIIITNFDNISDIDKRIAKVNSNWDIVNTLYVNEKKYSKAKEKVKKFNKYPEELSFLKDE